MRKLMTYGWDGKILVSTQGANIQEPAGSIIIDVPDGKDVASIDLKSGHAQPVFVDIPKTDVEKLQEQNSQLQTYIENMSQVVDVLLTMLAASNNTSPDTATGILDTLKGGGA